MPGGHDCLCRTLHTRVLGILQKGILVGAGGQGSYICSRSIYVAPTVWPSCIWHLRKQENKGEDGGEDTGSAGLGCPGEKGSAAAGARSTGSGSNKAQIFRKPGQSSAIWGDSPSGSEAGTGKPPQPFMGHMTSGSARLKTSLIPFNPWPLTHDTLPTKQPFLLSTTCCLLA